MPESPPDPADAIRRLTGRGVSSATFIPLDDGALVAAVEELTALRHEIERCQALAVAELVRRSRVPFGTRGLEGHLPIRFGHDGAVLDLGRDERLFTERQKVAFAVRDGGCLNPDCTRPPSWTEAHHIDHWHRDDGRTDLADGILLCRRDHLRYHNQGWEVRRRGATYWLIPPPGVDPERTPRVMRPRPTS